MKILDWILIAISGAYFGKLIFTLWYIEQRIAQTLKILNREAYEKAQISLIRRYFLFILVPLFIVLVRHYND